MNNEQFHYHMLAERKRYEKFLKSIPSKLTPYKSESSGSHVNPNNTIMQVTQEKALASAKKNLKTLESAVQDARAANIASVTANVEQLVDAHVAGAPLPVVEIKYASDRAIKGLQAFIEKVEVLAPDSNGAIAIEQNEFDSYVRDLSASVTEGVAKLVSA